jgi:hypothetical protein
MMSMFFVANDTLTLLQDKKTFEIPVSSITEISYGNDVHRRVGAAIGVGLVTFGIGAMVLLVKTKKHYVGVTWNFCREEGRHSCHSW